MSANSEHCELIVGGIKWDGGGCCPPGSVSGVGASGGTGAGAGDPGEQVLEFDRVNVYRLRDGQIVEIWSYDFGPYALDVLWA
jgi:hypothetical protein